MFFGSNIDKIIKSNFARPLVVVFLLVCVCLTPKIAEAKKGNEPVYQDPFDLAAGGASLTRASRAGRLFSNPALMSYGGGLSLWVGSTTSIFVNNGVCELVASPCPVGGAAAPEETSEADAAAQEATGTEESDSLKLAFKNPFRLGIAQSFAMIFSHVGFSIFSRSEIDLDAKKIGPSGTPTVNFNMESYSGLQVAGASRSPFRWLSFGGAARYIIASEPELNLGLDIIDKASDPSFFKTQLQDNFTPVSGVGLDVGSLVLLQGKNFDFSFAAKVDDIGNTKLTPSTFIANLVPSNSGGEGEGDAEADAEADAAGEESTADSVGLTEFKQVASVGLGFTAHTGGDQIHLSIDYRDVLNAYEDPMFKRVYAGVKMTVRQYIGAAVGIHHGYASAGLELNLIFLQISATTYKRELSDKPGINPRRYYMISISGGG